METSESRLWIVERIAQLKALYQKCTSEEALSSYIACIIRLLNGLAQINKTDFHRYERRILWEPMRIFSSHFIMQIEKTMAETDAGEKEKNISDIEEAVCKLSDIYENVINGTANTDKQMFMSMPVNSSLYEISPKLYAVYEDIIRDLTEIYHEEQGEQEYAFLLNPTLKNTLQEELLFQRREESGKVVIIHMPVRMMEDLHIVPLYLMHEVFHVLTKAQRRRRQRSRYLFANLIQQIGYRLFQGVKFSKDNKDKRDCEDCDIDEKICSYLLDLWMEDSAQAFDRMYRDPNTPEKAYYAKQISAYLVSIVESDLVKIDDSLEKNILYDVPEMIGIGENEDSFHEYNDIISNFNEQIQIIRRNLYQIRYDNTVEYLADRLLFLFKELYADLACVLTSAYDLEKYNHAFEDAMQFKIDHMQMNRDDYHKVRKCLVSRVLSRQDSEDANMDEAGEECFVEVNDLKQIREIDEIGGQNDGRYVILDTVFCRTYLQYLSSCKRDLQETLAMETNRKKVSDFQKKMKKFSGQSSDALFDILLGMESVAEK